MNYSFRVINRHDHTMGEEFIKLEARYNDGFRIDKDQVLRVEDNITGDIFYLQDNSTIKGFIKDPTYKKHHTFLVNVPSAAPEPGPDSDQPRSYEATKDISTRSLLPEGTQINDAKISNATIAGDRNFDVDLKKIASQVNPSHYQGYFQDYQWLEVMQGVMPKEQFNGLVLGTSQKYIARLGKKDDDRQDALKALWYLKFYTARLVAGRDVRVAEVDPILNSAK